MSTIAVFNLATGDDTSSALRPRPTGIARHAAAGSLGETCQPRRAPRHWQPAGDERAIPWRVGQVASAGKRIELRVQEHWQDRTNDRKPGVNLTNTGLVQRQRNADRGCRLHLLVVCPRNSQRRQNIRAYRPAKSARPLSAHAACERLGVPRNHRAGATLLRSGSPTSDATCRPLTQRNVTWATLRRNSRPASPHRSIQPANSSNSTPPSVNETRKTVHPSSSNPAGSCAGSIDDRIGCPNRTWYGLQCTSIMLEIERSAERPIPKRPKLPDSARLVLNHGIATPSTWRSRISSPLWLTRRSSSRSNNRTSDAPVSSAFCKISASPWSRSLERSSPLFPAASKASATLPGSCLQKLSKPTNRCARGQKGCAAHRRKGCSTP